MFNKILAGLILVFGVAVASVSVQTSTADAGIRIYIPTPGIHVRSRARCFKHRHHNGYRERHCRDRVRPKVRRWCHTRWRYGRPYRYCHRHRYRH